jgi:hypothetical protein
LRMWGGGVWWEVRGRRPNIHTGGGALAWPCHAAQNLGVPQVGVRGERKTEGANEEGSPRARNAVLLLRPLV